MNHIIKYSKNTQGRDFFTTDIHGHFTLLEDELTKIGFDESKDRLFVGGDNCDRGLESERILEYINKPWFISVRGNHEEMVMEYYYSLFDTEGGNSWQVYNLLAANGGMWYINLDAPTQRKIFEYFKSLPLAIELESKSGLLYGIVHAEVPWNNWEEFRKITKAELDFKGQAVCQWSRTKYDYRHLPERSANVKGVDYVLCGHTPTETGDVDLIGNQYYCDAGSFFRNRLNIMEIK